MEKILLVEIFLNLQLSTKLQPQKLKPAFQESCHRVLMPAREGLVLPGLCPLISILGDKFLWDTQNLQIKLQQPNPSKKTIKTLTSSKF